MLKEVTITYLEILKGDQVLEPHGFRSDAYKFVLSGSICPEFNKMMYNAVGKDYEWTDKSDWTNEEWRKYLIDRNITTYYVTCDGTPCGYVEIAYDIKDKSAQIEYFGLIKQYLGCGFGGWMLVDAIKKAFSKEGIDRVWLHTCTLDHDNALKNYVSRGMKIFKKEVVFR